MSKNVFDISQELMSNAYPAAASFSAAPRIIKRMLSPTSSWAARRTAATACSPGTEDGIRTEAFDPSRWSIPR